MATKQIDTMLSQLATLQEQQDAQPITVSYQLPSPELAPARANHQLIRSVLYMGQLVRGNAQAMKKGDMLVDSLETMTSVMDNVYLLSKLGIGSKSKWMQRLSGGASKVWFVTLLLMLRRIVIKIVRLMALKSSVETELRKCRSLASNELRRLIIRRYEDKLGEIAHETKMEWIELVGTVIDLGFVSIELFKWRVHSRLESVLGVISTVMSFYRMSRGS